MKLIHYFFASLPFLPLPLFGQESTFEAEAYWEAGAFSSAEEIYLKQLPLPLPDWQKKRLLYNLGTIRLAMNDESATLDYFQKITPSSLSLQRNGSSLFMNIGIAYLEYSRSLESLDMQALFIQEGQKALEKAFQLDCQVQAEEENQTQKKSCLPSFPLNSWMKDARIRLSTTLQSRSRQWIERAGSNALAEFIRLHLQDWSDRLNGMNLQQWQGEDSTKKAIAAYFHHQGLLFMPVWNTLRQKLQQTDKKSAIERSFEIYTHSLEELENDHPAEAATLSQRVIEALEPLGFQEERQEKIAHLNFETLLHHERPSNSALKALLSRLDALKISKDQSRDLQQIKKDIIKSQEEMQAGNSMRARFFLLAGFSNFCNLTQKKEGKPEEILQEAIDSAGSALQLILLSQMMESDDSEEKAVQEILKKQQKKVLISAMPFIPSVLKEQKDLFQEAKSGTSTCQANSWDPIIPLFDKGLRFAKKAQEDFDKDPSNKNLIFAQITQTLKNWEQALKFILNPPSQAAPQTEKNLSETYSLIQEMFLQDQSKNEPQSEELHSW